MGSVNLPLHMLALRVRTGFKPSPASPDIFVSSFRSLTRQLVGTSGKTKRYWISGGAYSGFPSAPSPASQILNLASNALQSLKQNTHVTVLTKKNRIAHVVKITVRLRLGPTQTADAKKIASEGCINNSHRQGNCRSLNSGSQFHNGSETGS